MMKRKEFILGAAVGLTFAAAATAGGVIDWPGANAQERPAAGRLVPSAGAAGLAFAPPQGAPLSFADIFDQVSPAVVQIDVETRINRPQGLVQIPGFPPGFGFRLPEGQTPPGAESEEGPTAQGAGSGFFISADGFIVTNNHVVENATRITVRLNDERELEATLVGRDQATDLAVLKVEGDSFPFVDFETQAEPRVGDWVIAVGNPFGLGGTATAGIVSAKARDIDGNTPYTDYLQIDAAINRGNSGGPTFDIYGRVIGVNSAIFSPTGGSVGIGFAIPASIAKSVTDRLMRGETIQRGYLGVQIQNLPDEYRGPLGLSADQEGAYVAEVTPGGPAAEAGLREGDIVVALNGQAIDSSSALTRRVGQAAPGDNLRLEIIREGRRQTLTVRSGTRPADVNALAGSPDDNEGNAQPNRPQAPAGEVVEGMTVAPLTDALRSRYSIAENVRGLVITAVSETSRAGRAQIPVGTVILQANGRPVASAADLREVVAAARAANRDSILLLFRIPAGNRPFVLELSDN
jgi:serine protease Do